MEFSHSFATTSLTAYPHELAALSTNDQQVYRDFEQDQQPCLQDPASAMYSMNGAPQGQRLSCGDVKPRLTKEQHDVLEAHYQKQQKPNTSTKRGFAESLNVSLEKVNNWFQNRRAKSKQDAKKQQGTVGIFNLSQPSEVSLSTSDSDTSPAFASAEYQQMMQHFSAEENQTTAAGTAGLAQTFERAQPQSHFQHPRFQHDVPRTHSSSLGDHNLLHNQRNDPLLDIDDMNRRTLTQEQFDLLNQPGLTTDSGDLSLLNQDQEAYNNLLSAYSVSGHGAGFGRPENLSISLPLEDSLPVSTAATNSAMLGYTAVSQVDQQLGSTSSSDWTDGSRSSSVSLSLPAKQSDLSVSVSPQQSSGQWQIGQSVPVDFRQLSEEFQKVAEANRHQQQLMETPVEQGMMWPISDMPRRDSSSSLVQSMGNVGLQTPQPPQQATFKSPTPVSSLAARRQKQRPTPLGLASLRSQSYSGSHPMASPVQTQQQTLSAQPQLRRIKSSNVVGGIATGRVQKNVAMPQRSPLSWTFQDALSSPQAVRHQASLSTSSLAPPTPLSPSKQIAQLQQQFQLQQQQQQQQQQHGQFDLHQQQQQWSSGFGNAVQQDTISEDNVGDSAAFVPTSASAPTFSSPPHTPMFHNQPQLFVPPQVVPGNMIMENTPPQSAPASQQSFSQGMLAPSPMQAPYLANPHPHQMMHEGSLHHPVPHQVMRHPVQQPRQQVFHSQATTQAMPANMDPQDAYQQDHHLQMSAGPQFTVTTSGPPMDMPMHFAQHGVPIVDAQGQIQMAMPSQLQFVQQRPARSDSQQAGPQAKYSPGGTQLVFASSPETSSPLQVTSQIPKHAASSSSDFFVHEYTPPQELKRSATPRKPVDTGPKNYTFANQTPQHFEKASKKADAKSSSTSSPETSSS